MDAPWWFAFGGAIFVGALAVMNFRHFRALWRRNRDHPEQDNDEWDPFG